MPQEGSGGEDEVGVRRPSWQTPECVRLLLEGENRLNEYVL